MTNIPLEERIKTFCSSQHITIHQLAALAPEVYAVVDDYRAGRAKRSDTDVYTTLARRPRHIIALPGNQLEEGLLQFEGRARMPAVNGCVAALEWAREVVDIGRDKWYPRPQWEVYGDVVYVCNRYKEDDPFTWEEKDDHVEIMQGTASVGRIVERITYQMIAASLREVYSDRDQVAVMALTEVGPALAGCTFLDTNVVATCSGNKLLVCVPDVQQRTLHFSLSAVKNKLYLFTDDLRVNAHD